MKRFIYLAFSLLLFTGCTWELKEYHVDFSFQPKEDAYYVYAIGDWGRNGEYGQAALAEMMGEAAEKIPPQFIISTGDNFYPNGVKDCSDPNWDNSFEDIYTAESLQCEWYSVLGNHDHKGNVQAQIDYTLSSERWKMPSRYFHKDILTEDLASVRFVFIDTSPFSSEFNYHDENSRQLQWMDSILAQPFDWKIVIGHHPIYTGGSRANDKSFVKEPLEKLFDRHQVHLYIAGHEHDLQYMKPQNHPTHHIISGAGSQSRPTGVLPITLFSDADLGFFIAGITRNSIECQFMNARGEIIYENTILKQ